MHHPELYGTIVSLSGYFVADPSGDARRVWGYHPSQELLQDESPYDYVGDLRMQSSQQFVFLGDGANERGAYKSEAAQFARKLGAAGIPYAIKTLPGKHSWDLWRQLLQDALLKLRLRIPGTIDHP
jgi:enterochelin esterase-like enzyme